ncbi:MAG: hypothetical protein Kow0079_16600 [Vicingaceae bacterium]
MLSKSYENGYRFGFNGQEKVDEISGTGNHNTALFREYDTRLGRRWNLDPKPQIFISDYAVMANNPIWFNDVLGDSIRVNGETYIPGKEYKGNDKFVKDVFNSYNELYKKSDEARKHINILSESKEDIQIKYGKNSKVGKVTINAQTGKIVEREIIWNNTGEDEEIPEQIHEGSLSSRLKSRPEISLIHESIHISRSIENKSSVGKFLNTGIKKEELETSHIENIIRSQMKLPLRTYYKVGTYSNGAKIGTGFPLLKFKEGSKISNYLWKSEKKTFKYL